MHKKRDFFLDCIRVFSTIGVIAVHCDSVTSSLTNYVGGISWWLVLFLHSLFICSVPLFAMLSGVLLLRKESLTLRYVLKKSGYFLFLLTVTHIAYKAWGLYQHGAVFSIDSIFFDLLYVRVGHLYYLAIAACLYLCAPLIKFALTKYSLLRIILVLVAGATLYEHASYLIIHTYNSTTVFFVGLPFISYLCLGYMVSSKRSNPQQIMLFSIFFFVISMLITLFTAYNIRQGGLGNMTFWTPQQGNFFWEPFTLPVLALSLIAFHCWYAIGTFLDSSGYKIIKKIINTLTPLTLGVYLVHPFIIEISETYLGLAVHQVNYSLFLYYVLKVTTVTVVSFFVVAAAHFIFQILVSLLPKWSPQTPHHH